MSGIRETKLLRQLPPSLRIPSLADIQRASEDHKYSVARERLLAILSEAGKEFITTGDNKPQSNRLHVHHLVMEISRCRSLLGREHTSKALRDLGLTEFDK